MKLSDLFQTRGADHNISPTSRKKDIEIRSKAQTRREFTTQNALNRSLFQPYASGLPFLIGDDQRDFINDGYRKNANLYAIINTITRSAAAPPWSVYVVKDKKAHHHYKNYSGKKRVKDSVRSKNIQKKALELAEESDLQGIIDRPNPMQGQSEFIENALGFKLLTGNTYIHGVEVDGTFGELWNMPSHLVEIISGGGVESVISGYRITDYTYDIELDAETVMHLKYWNPDYSSVGSHLYGMSPIQAARGIVTQSNDTYKANSRALQNMGAEGMLSADEEQLTDKQVDQMRKDLKARGTGPENLKKMLVSTAKWRWVRFGISPVDLNIIESMKMSLRDLCNVYGISSELLNDPDNKTNSNKKESRKALYYERVLPELDSLRDELNRWLVPDHSERDGVEYFIDYDISAIPALSEDMGEQIEALSGAPITINEFREAIGYGKHDDPITDEVWWDTNKVPVSFSGQDLSEDLKWYAKHKTNGVH